MFRQIHFYQEKQYKEKLSVKERYFSYFIFVFSIRTLKCMFIYVCTEGLFRFLSFSILYKSFIAFSC
jgi:hypothetical protein